MVLLRQRWRQLFLPPGLVLGQWFGIELMREYGCVPGICSLMWLQAVPINDDLRPGSARQQYEDPILEVDGEYLRLFQQSNIRSLSSLARLYPPIRRKMCLQKLGREAGPYPDRQQRRPCSSMHLEPLGRLSSCENPHPYFHLKHLLFQIIA